MNSLEEFIHSKNLIETPTMNALQDAGVVSDLCVFACDVAESDCAGAIAFLTFRKLGPQPEVSAQKEMMM